MHVRVGEDFKKSQDERTADGEICPVLPFAHRLQNAVRVGGTEAQAHRVFRSQQCGGLLGGNFSSGHTSILPVSVMGYATMVGMSDTFTIDIWSDIVCPFCYLGKKQLDIALTQFTPPVPVEIRLHAFELDPRAPASYDRPLAELLAKKYGVDAEEARRWHRRSEAEAANLGMEWRMDECRTGNTFDAHRLNALAATQGLGLQMNERLMRGYFSEGLLPSDHVALVNCATEVGVVVPSDFFASSEYVDEVRHDEARATDLGISGVPSMVLDGRFMLSGAQGVDAMVELLQRAYARRSR